MPLLTKKIELFENHGRECMQAAGRNNDPKRREMLLKLAREVAEGRRGVASGRDAPVGSSAGNDLAFPRHPCFDCRASLYLYWRWVGFQQQDQVSRQQLTRKEPG
jgi:hypothetical protein